VHVFLINLFGPPIILRSLLECPGSASYDMIAANHHIRQCFQRHRLYGADWITEIYSLPRCRNANARWHCRQREAAQLAGIGNISKRFL